MQRREQLTKYSYIDTKNIHFGEPTVSQVRGKDITYERIPITIKHDDKSFGSLLVKTERCFSFGAQQNINEETGEASGWTLPIAMYDRDDPSVEQHEWVEKFNEIVESCKEHVARIFDLHNYQLERIGSCMWWPKNEGIPDEKRGPTLYPKIVTEKTSKRFDTVFTLVNKNKSRMKVVKEEVMDYCNVVAVIRFDSIYVCNGNAHLQLKVYEAIVEKHEELPKFL